MNSRGRRFQQHGSLVSRIGTFDGVHLGHQKIIKQLVAIAKAEQLQALVLTFFPHPRMVVQEDMSIKLINTIDEKAELMQNLGVDHLVIKAFTKEFSNNSSEISGARDPILKISTHEEKKDKKIHSKK